MRTLKIGCFLLSIVLIYSCRKSFQPEIITKNSNFLVIEGFINTGSDSTFIKLSRTVTLAEKNSSKPETEARVSIESDQNQTYFLEEKPGGSYVAAPLKLDNNKKYRLAITTRAGKKYVSDFVESKVSPLIDSITWEAKSSGLQLYANTHDDQNKSIYYRWEYAETWEFTAQYYAIVKVEGTQIVPRNMETENIYRCWTSDRSKAVVLGSSVKLDKDVIYQSPLTLIPADSEKIGIRYSILVKQYALSKEAYDFWENLRKNTESLGSIFDAQPSQLTGNIHNVDDPEELVIGYISAGTTTYKRIFISKDKLPNWKVKYPYSCDLIEVYTINPETGKRDEDFWYLTGRLIPVAPFYVNDVKAGHAGSSRECVDCTLRGSNKSPEFWQ